MGTREAVGDQRKILLSMTKKYHQLKTGLLVRQKILPAVVLLSFVSDGMPYTGDSRTGFAV